MRRIQIINAQKGKEPYGLTEGEFGEIVVCGDGGQED